MGTDIFTYTVIGFPVGVDHVLAEIFVGDPCCPHGHYDGGPGPYCSVCGTKYTQESKYEWTADFRRACQTLGHPVHEFDDPNDYTFEHFHSACDTVIHRYLGGPKPAYYFGLRVCDVHGSHHENQYSSRSLKNMEEMIRRVKLAAKMYSFKPEPLSLLTYNVPE